MVNSLSSFGEVTPEEEEEEEEEGGDGEGALDALVGAG